ncbi:hypothetical protein DAEQUDRAFT_814284, partial [Daedalea quercina L-15889]
MIACSISAYPKHSDGAIVEEEQTKAYNCGPSQEVVLVDANSPIARALPVRVTITLTDWASVFELESVVVDSEDSIQGLPGELRPIRILAIGDSITAGYSDGSQPVPLGCLNSYPYIAVSRVQAETGRAIEFELVAFPGITLVAPTPEEADEGAGQGMIDRFFHASPWSDEPATLDEQPSIILIALGTNDDAQDVSPERFALTLRAFVQHLRTTYRRSLKHLCILHTFQDFTDELESPSTREDTITRDLGLNSASLTLDASHGVELHKWDIGKCLRKKDTMDGLHPTLSGHGLLGDALEQMIVPLLGWPRVVHVISCILGPGDHCARVRSNNIFR